MVFESIVVDILNKFLGNYVENLDKSQLKIGIWGGNDSVIFSFVLYIVSLIIFQFVVFRRCFLEKFVAEAICIR